jgi:dCTP deaminase
MSILTRTALIERMRGDIKSRLVVTPILSIAQIGDASIDVRLGNEFLLPTSSLTAAFEYIAENPMGGGGAQIYKRIRRDFGKPLYIHPGQLVLGSTFEFIRLPSDISAYVIGRSSLGRTGLVIATATAVAPGYPGCITLEIVNEGEVPLPLFPGMRIAQLVLHKTEGSASYSGRFRASVGPQPPMLWKDKEMKIWAPPPGHIRAE